MFRYVTLSCLLAQILGSSGNAINGIPQDQELVFAIVVNRHGERAPDVDELSLSDEQDKLRNITALEGPEGLTNVGKKRAYQIGKYIRQRYGSQGFNLISSLYRQEEIGLRSTDKERTKMTILMAMAAAYPPEPEQQWDEGLGKVWQPIPYEAVPLSEDYLRYYSNCKRFKQLMAAAKKEALEEEFAAYKNLLPIIQKNTGRNFSEDPMLYETLFDLFRSRVGLGLDIPKWAEPILPKLSEAARLAYRLHFRTHEMKRIGGGVLLNQFLEAADDIAAGKPVTKRLRIFSSHDFNIGALMDVAKVQCDHSIPEYGSLFALELYRSKSTGKFSVSPIYLTQAGTSIPQTLLFEGCNTTSPCDLNTFKDLTKEFVLTEQEYYQLCDIKTEL